MKLISVSKIWDKANHNAFTDLIYFNNLFYCAFREGTDHLSYDGKVRVLVSSDTKTWSSLTLLALENKDIRDPKFSISSNNELMINAALRIEDENEKYKFQSLTWFYTKNKSFSKPFFCQTSLGAWRWSTTWNDNVAYSFAYTGKHKLGCLYKSNDGKTWQIVQDKVFPKAKECGNESSIVFLPNNQAYCLLRRDKGEFTAMFGSSKAPYKKWIWKDLNRYIGGPKMIYVNEKFLIAGRFNEEESYTALAWFDLNNMELQKPFKVPSSGDSSYPGLVYKDKMVYMSYYSSHEDKTSIYLAHIKI